MEQQGRHRSLILRGIAKTLNWTGGALVASYDLSIDASKRLASVSINSSSALGRSIANAARHTTSAISSPRTQTKKTGNIFNYKRLMTSVSGIFGNEGDKIEAKIRDYEAKMHEIYSEVGSQTTSGIPIGPVGAETIDKMIHQARIYEDEIGRLKAKLQQIKTQQAQEKEAEAKKPIRPVKTIKTPLDQVERNIHNAIQRALHYGEFSASSERAIFEKVANDILESEMEIKILAATELGKMGNPEAVPILMESIKFDNTYLTTEIINSLINIGDKRAIPIFKAGVENNNYRVRLCSLRGIYKLSPDKEIVSTLVSALRDDHHEIRKTAVTFLGWKDDVSVVPSLIQCLKDEDDRVRAATVSALLNFKDPSSVMPLIKVLGDKILDIREKALDTIRIITGADIKFDIQSRGQQLYDEINNLRDWWLKERFGNVDIRFDDDDELSKAADIEPETAKEETAVLHPETAMETSIKAAMETEIPPVETSSQEKTITEGTTIETSPLAETASEQLPIEPQPYTPIIETSEDF